MKRTFFLGLLIGILATVSVVCIPNTVNSDQEFKWNNLNRDYGTLKGVRFQNDAVLTYLAQPKDYSTGPKIQLTEGNKSQIFLEDDYVYINAAYPSTENAQIAIISNACGGNICSWTPTYMVIPEQKTLKKYLIGNYSIDFDAKFGKKGLISARADNVVLGEDEFGTNIRGSIEYVTDTGFVVPEMKNYYKSLIGKYTFNYLDDKDARKSLANLLGPDKFRELRSNLSVSVPSQLINYRFLAFTGCMAHNCVNSYGAVIIDTTNDEVWWVKVDDRKYTRGSNANIPKDKISTYRNIFEKVNLMDDSLLSLSNDGNIAIKSRR